MSLIDQVIDQSRICKGYFRRLLTVPLQVTRIKILDHLRFPERRPEEPGVRKVEQTEEMKGQHILTFYWKHV